MWFWLLRLVSCLKSRYVLVLSDFIGRGIDCYINFFIRFFKECVERFLSAAKCRYNLRQNFKIHGLTVIAERTFL